MLTKQEQLHISDLFKAGCSAAEIAQRLGRSLITIYKYRDILDNQDSPDCETKVVRRASKRLAKFESIIDRQLKLGIKNSKKIFQSLLDLGYQGSYGAVNSYIRQTSVGEPKYIRSQFVETAPGQQAQVDWGSFGKIEVHEQSEQLYAFVLVLSYSRAMYAELVIKQNLQTFIQCHINAFNKLGIPKEILYDNVKTVILGRTKCEDGTTRITFNPTFFDFAKYYGFKPTVSPPYWPRSKGKVEAGVKYLRYNFAEGLLLRSNKASLTSLNDKLSYWLEHKAQVRVHKTTNEKPLNRWIEEKPFLRFPQNLRPYQTNPLTCRKCNKDGMVQYRSNFYSVPSKYSLKNLYIREVNDSGVCSIEIYYKNQFIGRHVKSSEKGRWVVNDKHLLKEDMALPRQVRGDKERAYLKVEVGVRELECYDQLIVRGNNGEK